MYIYIYICIYICTYIYICICISIYILHTLRHRFFQVQTHIRIHIHYVLMYIHIYRNIYLLIYTCAQIHIHRQTHIDLHVQVHGHMQIHVYTYMIMNIFTYKFRTFRNRYQIREEDLLLCWQKSPAAEAAEYLALRLKKFEGIGLPLDRDDMYACIQIDRSMDRKTGTLKKMAEKVEFTTLLHASIFFGFWGLSHEPRLPQQHVFCDRSLVYRM